MSWLRRTALKLALAGLAVVCSVNALVAYFGRSAVPLWSPFALQDKVQALGLYAVHRVPCLLFGHSELDAEVIRAAERKHRLPAGLLAALVQVESGGEAHRISPAAAMGPAQLVPGTVAALRVRDPYDPRQALDGGARYLAAQLERYHSVPLALAAYNAGPGAVDVKVPENGETEVYVQRVMARWRATKPGRAAR